MSTRRVSSHKKVKTYHRARILEEALRAGANISSKRGFAELRHFAEYECGIVIDNRVLNRLLCPPKEIMPEHKELIIQEAIRLNGSANSTQGFAQLRSFAVEECNIMIDDSILSRLLKDAAAIVSSRSLPTAQNGNFVRAAP
jgi:hypothetical protein